MCSLQTVHWFARLYITIAGVNVIRSGKLGVLFCKAISATIHPPTSSDDSCLLRSPGVIFADYELKSLDGLA